MYDNICERMQQIKNSISTQLYRNIYYTDLRRRFECRENNTQVISRIKEFEKIDSIQNFDLFKSEIKDIIASKENLSLYCIGQESLLYGHIQAFYDYAGIKFKTPLYISNIEHGVNFTESETVFEQFFKATCYIFQGKYKFDMAKKKGISAPIYAVGPYIHYAKPSYSSECIQKLKNKYGKTLLVFPAHTFEMSSINYRKDSFVNTVIEQYAADYDTIVVCAYWLDVFDRVYQDFQDCGAMIVSAGARFDPNFIRRLKTIIMLSDAVLFNDIGTNIGYSIYLNKKTLFTDSSISRSDVSLQNGGGTVFKRNHDNIAKAIRNSEFQEIRKFYEYFWGGEQQILSKQEMKALIESVENRVKIRLGFA